MQFFYHPESGESKIKIEGEEHKYLFKVRRESKEKPLHFRNLNDGLLYTYRAETVGRRDSVWILEGSEKNETVARKTLHLGWCVVDSRVIEKTLPMLNEMGVSKISFVFSERSQRQNIPDFDRLKRILVNSCQQCGRSDLMEFEIRESLDSYLEFYSDTAVLDFSENALRGCSDIESILVGPEGGFSESERKSINPEQVFGFEHPLILRSESAAVSAAALILL